MQTVLVSRVEAVKDFALDTDILKDAQFDTDYCFVSIPFYIQEKFDAFEVYIQVINVFRRLIQAGNDAIHAPC